MCSGAEPEGVVWEGGGHSRTYAHATKGLGGAQDARLMV